jgi:hypothetical protein
MPDSAENERDDFFEDREVTERRIADYVVPPCGVCGRPAEVVATVPMCGQRPRYPMCHECFEPINWNGYAEDVEVLS